MKIHLLGLGALFLLGAPCPVYAQDILGGDGKESDDKVARIIEQLGSESKVLRETAQKQLDELDKEALDALKREADRAKKDGNADLELKLRSAIDRLQAPDKAVTDDPEEADLNGILGKGIRLKVLPGGKGISRVESDADGERTVTQTEDGKTTTLKKCKESDKITAEIEDGKGNVEKLEFKDEAEMKEKNPKLHEIWKDTGGPVLRLFDPKNLPNGGAPNGGSEEELDEEARKQMEEMEKDMREFEKQLEELLKEVERQMREAEEQQGEDGSEEDSGDGNREEEF
ncbi:MAG: hypothetical protein L6Q71_00435 [Planctomycetes bacterium]|nr:hypothetical protein [Planctomycetota bacterium]NUQ35258.1 hypothetical protein [Planctomycetaceae bacterium]